MKITRILYDEVRDPVYLEKISTAVSEWKGVRQAHIVMGLPETRRRLLEAGFFDPAFEACRENDMIIAIELENHAMESDIFSRLAQHIGNSGLEILFPARQACKNKETGRIT